MCKVKKHLYNIQTINAKIYRFDTIFLIMLLM